MDFFKKELEYLSTNDIKSYKNNMRTHSREQIDQIVDSIEQFGFTNPILIDANNVIIAGHGRLEAARKMKMRQVPCIRFPELSEAQAKALRIADNQLALNAGWDFDMLKAELDSLQSLDFDLKFTGFSENELSEFMNTKISFDDKGGDDDGDEKFDIKKYSDEIKTPIYEPLGLNVTLKDCLDVTKTQKLIKEIEAADITEDEKTFLKCAAYRHTVFNYKNTAEYYAANASPEMQRLMENSALVIIDFERAIELGYVKLSKRIEEIMNVHGVE